MTINLKQTPIRNVLFWLYLCCSILLIVFAWLWYTRVYLNANRVFQGMLERSLQTTGVTVQTQQGDNTSSVSQTVQYALSAQPLAHSYTSLTRGSTEVKTEIIGTQAADYKRYLSIKADQAGADGKPINTTALSGVWAKVTNDAATIAASGSLPLLDQAVVGAGSIGSMPVPFVNLTASQRSTLLKQIHDTNLYTLEGAPTKQYVHGRLLYTYKVQLQAIPYVNYLKTLSAYSGFHDFDSIDPNGYSGEQPLELSFVVNANTRQLSETSLQDGTYKQTYTDYGLNMAVAVPQQTVSQDDMNKRLQAL